jgi:HPt (histidine-containing phosphotransfer) domain-containing protein
VKKPRSIEANLVSLALTVGLLLAVLVLALVGVERSLGGTLERLGSSTMPAQQGITGLRHAVSRLFERQVQVLSARSEAELAPLQNRAPIERAFGESRVLLGRGLPEITGVAGAAHEDGVLAASTRDVLATDAALLASAHSRLGFEAQLEARTAGMKTELEQSIQEARAVAGVAHLDCVLELRRVARGASADAVVRGNARAQQDAAGELVTAVLQLGQLVGTIELARSQDELNSIVANQLAQNLSRARTKLRVLRATLEARDAVARAEKMQNRFELIAGEINGTGDAHSLVELRRHVLVEAAQAAELSAKIARSALGISSELESVEKIVAHETQTATHSAERAGWIARLLSMAAFAAAIGVGLHSARRLRESVHGLRAQNRELESLSHDLKSMNEGLEGLVAERSAALVTRERSMRLVLDAMSEALIPADLAGRVAGECSHAAVAWFGEAVEETPIWRYLFAEEPALQQRFELGYEQLAQDLLPFEVSADCMPKRFEKAGRVFALDYRQVLEAGRFQRVLVVVHDITHEVAAEARERDARERHQLLAHLLKDKQGFRAFVIDGERLLAELLAEPEREQALRALHTLKGNTAVYGMESVAARCHELEDTLAERGDTLRTEEAKTLSQFWRGRLAPIEDVLSADTGLEINEGDFTELLQGLRQRRDYADLIALVESFKWTSSSLLLGRLAAQADRVAERIGKSVEVHVEHNRLRVMPGALEDFWSSLIHVVRNAVDHGVESADERRAQGKPAAGQLVLRTSALASGGLAVEFADDGGGIDFTRLRAICEERGVKAASRADLLEAMFQDGITTRNEATDVSGRGVGLGAVVGACREAGGNVEVVTQAGRGTRFRFAFPKLAVQVRDAPPRSSRSARRKASLRPERPRDSGVPNAPVGK